MILKTPGRVSETMKFLKDPLYHKINKMSRKKRIRNKKVTKMVGARVKLTLDNRWEQLGKK